VDIKVVVELFVVLSTETSPCSFNQLYNIFVSTFIYSLVQRVEDKDLASRHTKIEENPVEVVHRCRSIILVSKNMECDLKKINR
jgi:hypothetical protein